MGLVALLAALMEPYMPSITLKVAVSSTPAWPGWCGSMYGAGLGLKPLKWFRQQPYWSLVCSIALQGSDLTTKLFSCPSSLADVLSNVFFAGAAAAECIS